MNSNRTLSGDLEQSEEFVGMSIVDEIAYELKGDIDDVSEMESVDIQTNLESLQDLIDDTKSILNDLPRKHRG